MSELVLRGVLLAAGESSSGVTYSTTASSSVFLFSLSSRFFCSLLLCAICAREAYVTFISLMVLLAWQSLAFSMANSRCMVSMLSECIRRASSAPRRITRLAFRSKSMSLMLGAISSLLSCVLSSSLLFSTCRSMLSFCKTLTALFSLCRSMASRICEGVTLPLFKRSASSLLKASTIDMSGENFVAILLLLYYNVLFCSSLCLK